MNAILPEHITAAKALEYYQIGCERNQGAACKSLGSMHFSGEAGKKDDEAAFALMKKACELGDLNGCADYSGYLRAGIGTDTDLVLSRKIAATACNDGSPTACHTYGQAAIRGQGGEKDYEQAAIAFDSACRAKIGLACNNLAIQFLNGWGVEKNKNKARDIFKRSCDLKDPLGCQNYQKMLPAGDASKEAGDTAK